MHNEIWKDIEGYEGKYQISSFGRIKSFISPTSIKLNRGRILRPWNNGNKYLKITLAGYSKRRVFFVHRLVAKAFIDNPKNKLFVNHKNCCVTDNNYENLEWVTCEENIHYAKNQGHMKRSAIQRDHYRKSKTRYSKPVVRYTDFGNQKYYISMSAAEKEGYTRSQIRECCAKENKIYKGYLWKYA